MYVVVGEVHVPDAGYGGIQWQSSGQGPDRDVPGGAETAAVLLQPEQQRGTIEGWIVTPVVSCCCTLIYVAVNTHYLLSLHIMSNVLAYTL